jgi:hypothetical protein
LPSRTAVAVSWDGEGTANHHRVLGSWCPQSGNQSRPDRKRRAGLRYGTLVARSPGASRRRAGVYGKGCRRPALPTKCSADALASWSLHPELGRPPFLRRRYCDDSRGNRNPVECLRTAVARSCGGDCTAGNQPRMAGALHHRRRKCQRPAASRTGSLPSCGHPWLLDQRRSVAGPHARPQTSPGAASNCASPLPPLEGSRYRSCGSARPVSSRSYFGS